MEIKKVVLYFSLSLFLTGCFQSTAMVGPAMTLASTGNVSQAGITYLTNKAVEKETGMTTTEYVSSILDDKSRKKRKTHEKLIILVQKNFEVARKKILLQNQSKIPN